MTDTTKTCKKCGAPLDPDLQGSEWVYIGWKPAHRTCITWNDRLHTKNALAAVFLICAIVTTAWAVLAITTGTGMPTVPTGDVLIDATNAGFGWLPALTALIFWVLFLSAFFFCG